MCVNGVVNDSPKNIGGEEASRRDAEPWTERVNAESGATHEDGPRKWEAEHHLRIVGHALCERVECEQDCNGEGVIDTLER